MHERQPLKANVQNGRVVLNDPTDLPNGTELYVVPVEQLGDVLLLRDNGLDDDERKRLHESIRQRHRRRTRRSRHRLGRIPDELDAQP